MTKLTVKILIAVMFAAILAQASFGQKNVSAQKRRLVSQLVEKTYQIYPAEQLNGAIDDTKGEMSAMFKNQVAAMITAKINARADLSEEKKDAAKNKLPELTDRFAARLDALIRRDYKPEQWVKDSLRQNYTTRLTVSDLKKINVFLAGADGRDFIEMIKKRRCRRNEERSSRQIGQRQARIIARLYQICRQPVSR